MNPPTDQEIQALWQQVQRVKSAFIDYENVFEKYATALTNYNTALTITKTLLRDARQYIPANADGLGQRIDKALE